MEFIKKVFTKLDNNKIHKTLLRFTELLHANKTDRINDANRKIFTFLRPCQSEKDNMDCIITQLSMTREFVEIHHT